MAENDFQTCPKCGKPLIVPAGRKWCPNCALMRARHVEIIEDAITMRGLSTVEEIALDSGIDFEDVQTLVLETPALRREVDAGAPCMQCGEALAQKGSQYCFTCRIDLFNTLDEAAGDLLDKVERFGPVHESSSVASLRELLDQKRARTRTARFNPTPELRRPF